jgi:hypothetical protein
VIALKRVTITVSVMSALLVVASDARAKSSEPGSSSAQRRCPAGEIAVEGGCARVGAVRRHVVALARQALAEHGSGPRSCVLMLGVGPSSPRRSETR